MAEIQHDGFGTVLPNCVHSSACSPYLKQTIQEILLAYEFSYGMNLQNKKINKFCKNSTTLKEKVAFFEEKKFFFAI